MTHMPSDRFSGRVELSGRVVRIARVVEAGGLITYLLVDSNLLKPDVLLAVLPGSFTVTAGFLEKGDEIEAVIAERTHGTANVVESLRIKGLNL